MGSPLLTFTTDYGTVDAFVAVCKGVVLAAAPAATIVDVTHQVPAGDVRRGSHVLAEAVSFFPAAVHLAVVDPGRVNSLKLPSENGSIPIKVNVF